MAIIWNNVVTTPNRWMASWLRRRGWICFYLEAHSRECHDMCWMRLYLDGEKQK